MEKFPNGCRVIFNGKEGTLTHKTVWCETTLRKGKMCFFMGYHIIFDDKTEMTVDFPTKTKDIPTLQEIKLLQRDLFLDL